MGYLTMCALSARARRCGSCVLRSPCPRGDLSTWCVERAIAAATLQGVPGARPGDCVVGLLCMVMQPPEPVATDRQAAGAPTRPHGWLAPPGPGARASRLRRFHRPPDRRRAVPARPQTLGDGLARSHGHAVPGGRPGLARLPVVPSGNARPPRVADRGRGHAEASRAVPHHVRRANALPEPRTEGRAIDPAAVERMFDATRGAHVSPGELEHLWRGQPGPPAVAWYCTGIDWAQKRDSTVAAVVRCETTPLQVDAAYRTQRPMVDHDRAGRLPPRCVSGAGGT